MSVLAAAFVYRVPELAASYWNPHVLVLASLLLVVLCAAVAAGRHALLPAIALVGSFVVQTHLGLAPTALATVRRLG